MDLTGFYYSIAGCSGTIVAIIGGFIASKLITISSERDAVVEKLDEINVRLKLKREYLSKIGKLLDVADALDFIEENIAALIEGEDFNDIYKPEENEVLDAPVLEEYWKQATNVLEEFSNLDAYDENSDGIPIEFALKHERGFEYDVCRLICEELERIECSAEFMGETIYNMNNLAKQKAIKEANAKWYEKTQDEFDDLKLEIHEIELEQRLYEEKKQAIRKPKGMKSGLIIFALFTLTGVIYPLLCAVLSMYLSFPNWTFWGWTVKSWIVPVSVFGLFVIGIISTFTYLALLLRWKPQKESSN